MSNLRIDTLYQKQCSSHLLMKKDYPQYMIEINHSKHPKFLTYTYIMYINYFYHIVSYSLGL